MFTWIFWKDLLERAIATFAEVVGALAGTNMVGWVSLGWTNIFLVAGIAAGLAVLKGLAAYKIGSPTPSVVTYDTNPVDVVDADA